MKRYNVLNASRLRPHRMLMVCVPAPYVNHTRTAYGHGMKDEDPPEDVMNAQAVPTIPWLDLTQAVRSDACVMFTGDEETAEVLARRVHVLSGWRRGPFVPVNCGEPADRLEARLFELLDVENPRPLGGPLPTASQCGTIFLRDVGRLPRQLQRRLSDRLAVLRPHPGETHRIRRRVISSTPTSLVDRVENGTFDGSLYYRLNVIHLVISPGQ